MSAGNRTKGVRFELALPDELWTALLAEARTLGCAAAEVVRGALRERYARPKTRR